MLNKLKQTFGSMADAKHSLMDLLFDVAMIAGVVVVYMLTVAIVLTLINILAGCDAADGNRTLF